MVTWRRRAVRTTVRTVAVCAVLMLWATPAVAHSFLAATDPPQGARLSDAPDDMALQFSEAVLPDAVELSLQRSDHVGDEGLHLPDPRLESGGAVVRQPLPDLDSGIYVVSWQVTSAVDGHSSAGELAFAAGTDRAGQVPVVADLTPEVDAVGAALAWLFYAGLSVAAAGVATIQLGDRGVDRMHRWLRGGALIALAAVTTRVVIAPAVTAVGMTRLALPAAAAVLGVVVIIARMRQPLVTAGLLVTAAAAWGARSHAAAGHGLIGTALDAIHLVAAVAWTGGLAAVVLTLWGARRQGRTAVAEVVRQYARLALALVAFVSFSGIAQAALLLPGWAALWSTSYGAVLLVKTGLLVAALLAATAARTWGLPTMRLALLGRVTAAELGLLAAVLSVAALLVSTTPPTPADSVEPLLGPPPLTGPTVRAMDLAGTLTIDVVAGENRLDVTVLSPSGGVEGAVVDLSVMYPDFTRAELHPRPCGAGCLTMQHELPVGETLLEITAEASGWTGGHMQVPLQWPPPEAVPERFNRMVEAMRASAEVMLTEAVTSNSQNRDPSAREMSLTGEQFVDLMPWAGGGVVDIRPIDDRADAFSFYLAGSRMLFEVVIDSGDRLIRQRMVNPGHEIRYTFSYPNPPTPRTGHTEQP